MNEKKVIVCGTNYGKAYLSAFLSENPNFKLVGIFSKGSKRSQEFAKGLGVPLFKKIEDVPPVVDIACIAVRSSIMGGDGTKLALQFMERGIHVIQEHPVHSADIQKCSAQAKKYGVCYHINSHFVHSKSVRIFIDYVQKAVQHEQPLFIEATTSLLYSLIDILGRALGGCTPYGFTQSIKWDTSLIDLNQTPLIPFRSLQGIFAGTPISLNFQNFYEPKSNIDDSLLLLHRVCIGMPSGNITLLNTHGPVVWSVGNFPLNGGESSSVLFSAADKLSHTSNTPSSIIFPPNNIPSVEEICEKYWPAEVLLALDTIKEQIISGIVCPWQKEKYLLEVSQAWIDITRKFGPPDFISLPSPPPPFPDPLIYKNEMLSD